VPAAVAADSPSRAQARTRRDHHHLASQRGDRARGVDPRVAAVIRIDPLVIDKGIPTVGLLHARRWLSGSANGARSCSPGAGPGRQTPAPHGAACRREASGRAQAGQRELTHFVSDGDVPISNNWFENQIRPITVGRSNWLFAGSLRAGKRRGHHEPAALGTHQPTRPVRLLQGRAGPLADSPVQPHRRAAAASLVTNGRLTAPAAAPRLIRCDDGHTQDRSTQEVQTKTRLPIAGEA